MKSKQWRQVETIFHKALSLDGERRVSYLSEACSGDAMLLSEVDSLISAFEQKSGFLEQPAFSLGINVLQRTQVENLTGKQIGYYQIKEKLGGGGMGDVYLAEDTRLNRNVALKFLKKTFVDDKWAKRQLIREAQAVAMLEHPNICHIHSIEEIDEHNFIAMQFVEGKTLAKFIVERELSIEDILSIARQIVNAVAVAHSHGIIHRDIKPGNIMITPEGQVKVLDFGLAKVVQKKQKEEREEENTSHFSQNGLIIGTVAYMSPEQLRTEKLDYRSDIFSVGIVLYEMLCRQNPFNRKSQAEIIASILSNEPVLLKNSASQIPDALAVIVQKCLNKNKEKRFQSASELLIELENFKNGITVNSIPRRFGGIRNYAVLSFLLLVSIGIGLFFYLKQTTSKVPTFAILIVNESNSPENDYLSEGLTESLTNKLARSAKIRVKASAIVSKYKGQENDPQKVGKELSVDSMLIGKIVRRGDFLLLAASFINISDGAQLWSDTYKIEGTDLLTSPEDLSTQITSTLQVVLNDDEKQLLSKRQTNYPEANDQYLRGLYYLNNRDRRNIEKAITHFKTAIDIDPRYAQAWSGLADSYVLKSLPAYGSSTPKDAMTKARFATAEALKIDPNLGEALNSLGMIQLRYEWDWKEAEHSFLNAIEQKPNYAPPHYWYSNLLIIKKDFEKALSEAEKAKELDPLSPNSEINIGRVLYYARQSDKAIQVLTEILKNNPTNQNAAYLLGLTHMQKGQYNEAVSIFEKFYDENKLYFAAQLGYAYGKINRKAEALKVLDELERLSEQNIVPPQEKAIIYLGLDDKDKAFELLNRSCEERFSALPFVLTEQFFDGLREDSRFNTLTNCVETAIGKSIEG